MVRALAPGRVSDGRSRTRRGGSCARPAWSGTASSSSGRSDALSLMTLRLWCAGVEITLSEPQMRLASIQRASVKERGSEDDAGARTRLPPSCGCLFELPPQGAGRGGRTQHYGAVANRWLCGRLSLRPLPDLGRANGGGTTYSQTLDPCCGLLTERSGCDSQRHCPQRGMGTVRLDRYPDPVVSSPKTKNAWFQVDHRGLAAGSSSPRGSRSSSTRMR